jgi:ribosomal protein S18 acetylase RimI-like enzyme
MNGGIWTCAGTRGWRGAVMDWGKGKRIAVYDDPGTESTDLFTGLLILCEKRAVNMLHELNDPKKQTISNFVSDSAQYQKDILEEAGYSIKGFIFNMHIDLKEELPLLQLPEGITIRSADAKKDARAIHALIQEAFDWKERDRLPYAEWEKNMMRPENHDESLWFLAVKDKEIIGTCLGVPYSDLGWVRQLAVRKPYRKQGIGRALLQIAFRTFQDRSFPKAGLAVESDNEKAYRFYENIGMYKAVHYDEYVKKVPPIN